MPSQKDEGRGHAFGHAEGVAAPSARPAVELQLKCAAAPQPTGNAFAHSIKLKNYDDLRAEDLLVPRILVVVLVPESPAEWLAHSEQELAMRRCGYWCSLRGLPASANTTGQTVQMPRSQALTVPALQALMARVGQGELP